MANLGYFVNMGKSKAKVFELTQTRPTSFTDGITGSNWVKWFHRRHPYLTLRSSQGLEIAHACAMCPENVTSFYDNLKLLYTQHNYAPDHIWNCDEMGAHVSALVEVVCSLTREPATCIQGCLDACPDRSIDLHARPIRKYSSIFEHIRIYLRYF
jgi:hypothetical protein